MAFLSGLGSFAGGLAQGIDQGQVILQRKQQLEQEKQARQLLIANSLSSVFDPNLPAAIGSLKLKAVMTAAGIDPASESGKMFIDSYKSMDEQTKAALTEQMKAAGLTPDQILAGLKMYAGTGRDGTLKWLDLVGQTSKDQALQAVHQEAADLLKDDGPGGAAPDPAAERYRLAGDFYESKGMREDANLMYAQAKALGLDIQTASPGTTLGYFDPTTRKFTEVYKAQPAAGAVTNIYNNMPTPLPEGVQEKLTGGLQTLRNLDTMEQFIDETGRVKGLWSKAGAWTGTNEAAIAFETASNNTLLQSQSLIQGIPSNYDAGLLTNITPQLMVSQAENKARISAMRDVTRNMIRETIAYYKGSKIPIPPGIEQLASQAGIDTAAIPAWDGQSDPLQNTIAATDRAVAKVAGGGEGGGDPARFSNMTAEELVQVDTGSLSAEEKKALGDRLTELGY